MIALSKDTERLIYFLFEGENRKLMRHRLVMECSEGIHYLVKGSPVEMERVRFAVIKLCSESPDSWDDWFDLAKTDWKALFIRAGFGDGVNAHIVWKNHALAHRWK